MFYKGLSNEPTSNYKHIFQTVSDDRDFLSLVTEFTIITYSLKDMFYNLRIGFMLNFFIKHTTESSILKPHTIHKMIIEKVPFNNTCFIANLFDCDLSKGFCCIKIYNPLPEDLSLSPFI